MHGAEVVKVGCNYLIYENEVELSKCPFYLGTTSMVAPILWQARWGNMPDV